MQNNMILVFMVSCSLFVTVLPMSQNFGDFVGYIFFLSFVQNQRQLLLLLVFLSFQTHSSYRIRRSSKKKKKKMIYMLFSWNPLLCATYFSENLFISHNSEWQPKKRINVTNTGDEGKSEKWKWLKSTHRVQKGKKREKKTTYFVVASKNNELWI